MNIDDLNLETMTKDAPLCGFSSDEITDDRRDPEHEPPRLTAESWKNSGFYAVTIKADSGDVSKTQEVTANGYDRYISARDYLHQKGYCITAENFQTEADYFPGLLTYETAEGFFKSADCEYIEMEHFPVFSDIAKIRTHDSIIIAADTGAGKSSLAINFLNDLNDKYPVIYFNLEMDNLTILQRLVAIRTGEILDRIEGYQNDNETAKIVNKELQTITSRKPLQIISDAYTIEAVEEIIEKSTRGRTDPTMIFIDHALLLKTSRRTTSRYERFTEMSEELRRIAREYNVVLWVLDQQNREGKKDPKKKPTNDSLKESGSFENDATIVFFLWEDPDTNKKQIVMTKNRHGVLITDLDLQYNPRTQTYNENPEFRQLEVGEYNAFDDFGEFQAP